MKYLKQLSIALMMSALVACGGGGGNAGSTSGIQAGTDGTSATGDSQTTVSGSMNLDVLSGAGVSTNSISAVEISKVQAVLKDSAGKPVPGAVVSFSETGSGLLVFSPTSKTALTDSNGLATMEIRAATTTSTGATTVVAQASVSKVSISAEKAIAISSIPADAGAVVDPQAVANAVNFLDTNPADKSIVIAGAGGNGRSESATLRYRVVDKNNTPVKGAVVTFAAVPSTDVLLNITSATSDADGVVVTTVSSKTKATSVVVKATVTRTDSSTIYSQSDTLLVTTGTATPGGFDLSATKFNLNSGISGDSSTITVRVVDSNGNPVADGVPVVFTAPYGAVGTSSRGGCLTLNGACTVEYSVQNPRPEDGVTASVTASTQVGDGTAISGMIGFNFSQPGLLDLYTTETGGSKVTEFKFKTATCGKESFSAYIGTPAGRQAPAGTTVKVESTSSDVSATVKFGSPVVDQTAEPWSRTRVDIEIDIPAGDLCTTGVPINITFAAGSTSRRITLNAKGG